MFTRNAFLPMPLKTEDIFLLFKLTMSQYFLFSHIRTIESQLHWCYSLILLAPSTHLEVIEFFRFPLMNVCIFLCFPGICLNLGLYYFSIGLLQQPNIWLHYHSSFSFSWIIYPITKIIFPEKEFQLPPVPPTHFTCTAMRAVQASE